MSGHDYRRRPMVVLAGGGTAGHVLPALAIARALVEAGHPVDRIRFVGSASGMEATMVPAAGFELTAMELRNFRRSLRPSDLLGSALASIQLGRGIADMWRQLRASRASVVITVGGFVSVPTVVAARCRRIPVVVVSYDAKPGLANRLASRVATVSAVAFAPSSLPHSVVTGAPVRPEVSAIDRSRDRAEARELLQVAPDRFLVVAFGGSLGSGKINAVIDEFVAGHRQRSDLTVRHLVGVRNHDGDRRALPGTDGLQYQVVGFEEHMERCLAGCDLLVARAGASTVAEVGAVGVPSILIPWKDAAADHQTANARSLADGGGAVMVPEAQFDEPWLSAQVEAFLADRASLDRLGERAGAAGRKDGASRIAALALEVARGV